VVFYRLRWRGEGEVVRDTVLVLFNVYLSWIRIDGFLVPNPALYHWTTKVSVEQKIKVKYFKNNKLSLIPT